MAQSVNDRLQGLMPTVADNDVRRLNRETITVMSFDTAADVAETSVWRAPCNGKLVAAHWNPDVALGVDPANYVTMTLARRDSADYTTADTMASQSTETGVGAAIVAWTPWALTLTAANLTFGAADNLTFKIVDNGTTAPQSGCLVITVEYEDE